jgi:hypothetical protein
LLGSLTFLASTIFILSPCMLLSYIV